MYKLTPEEIASRGFDTRFRGYDVDQVHEFLATLAREWAAMTEQNEKLQAQSDQQVRELADYRRRERSLVEALETARKVADDIRHKAERDAELVLAETELKAEKMLAQAQRRLEAMRTDLLDVQQQRVRVESELRAVLQGHLKMLDLLEPVQHVGRAGMAPAKPRHHAPTPPTMRLEDEDIEESHSAPPTRESDHEGFMASVSSHG